MISDATTGLKVPRRRGEAVRRSLISLGCLDRSRKIFSEGDFICLPVRSLDENALDQIRSISEFDVADLPFQPEAEIVTAESLLGFKPSFDIVGRYSNSRPRGCREGRISAHGSE